MMHLPLYEKLKKVAAAGRTITYGDAGKVASLGPRDPELHAILDEVSEREHAARRPLLSVIVVRLDTGMPGLGFFKLPRRLGLLEPGESNAEFFRREVNRVYQVWAGSGTGRTASGLVAEAESSTEETARALWRHTEPILHEIVETVLVRQYGDSWRKTALPASIQMAVEKYPKHVLTIKDLAAIIKYNWGLFSRYFDREGQGKNRALEWLFMFNDVRRRLAHPPELKTNPITSDEATFCQGCHEQARQILAAVEATK